MKLIKIQRILNKTDLGLSGKHGCEILLGSTVKKYFTDLEIDEETLFKDKTTNESLFLILKDEVSTKFTSSQLKKYFRSRDAEEGDIVELSIEIGNTKQYFVDIIKTNFLLFKKNTKNNLYYSLSESKLKEYLDSTTQTLIVKDIMVKRRTDAKEATQHYRINSNQNMIMFDMSDNKITQIENLNNIQEETISIENEEFKKEYSETVVSTIRPSSRIINAIGKDLIKDTYAAIIELVKNSYDADSEIVSIVIEYDKKNKLLKTVVQDSGHGMTLETILDVWLVPATSDKLKRKKSPKGRFLQGKKGIGRYASGILGNLLYMESLDENNNLSEVVIDFDEIEKSKYLSDVEILIDTGVKTAKSGVKMEITSSNVSEKDISKIWDENQIKKLKEELSKLKVPLVKNTEDKFDIVLEFRNLPIVKKDKNKKSEELVILKEKLVIQPLPLIDYYDYRVHGNIDNEGNVSLYYNNQNIENVKEERIDLKVNLKDNYTYCGNIEFDFRVFDRDPDSISRLLDRGLKKFSVNKTQAKELIDSMYGVGIYRDIFRIRPYGDPDYDWLELDKDRVQNPSFNIGMNQIIGFIGIEGEEYSSLFEKSARDGLIENNAYFGLKYILKQILISILQPKRFEYRKQVGRGRKPKTVTEKIESLFDFEKIENKVKTLGLDVKNTEAVLKIIENERNSKDKELKDIKEIIAVYQGQVTLGKITEVLMHESRKSLRYLNEQIPRINKWTTQYIEKPSSELKDKIFQRSENTVFHVKELSNLFAAIEPLALRKATKKTINLYEITQKAYFVFENEMKRCDIEFVNNIDKELNIIARESRVYRAFVNFFENSIYWLTESSKEDKIIRLNSANTDKAIVIEVHDSGPGISSEIADLVFEPNFSLKEGGTGLGLSIAAEALKESSAIVSVGDESDGTTLYIEFIKEKQ